MQANHYVTTQITENGKPIDDPRNKDERGLGEPMEPISSDKLAKVKYGIGMTINLGDYQMARVDIGIELPAHIDTTEAAYNGAVDFCNEKLMDEVANLKAMGKALGKKGGK